jgi:hypothetical protein
MIGTTHWRMIVFAQSAHQSLFVVIGIHADGCDGIGSCRGTGIRRPTAWQPNFVAVGVAAPATKCAVAQPLQKPTFRWLTTPTLATQVLPARLCRLLTSPRQRGRKSANKLPASYGPVRLGAALSMIGVVEFPTALLFCGSTRGLLFRISRGNLSV